MCGIAGILLFESKESISLASLKIMTDAIAHRGPDGEGQWVDPSNGIGLGHRRLSIIDLTDAGAQPMHYIGRYSITFNGEIYNYIELRQELEQKGIVFHTHTDTEVLLALYHLEGEACLNRLDGMWAFAIWDSEKKELFCARDRFGEKPFFYYQDNKGFYFASEMKALWALGVSKEVAPEMKTIFETQGVAFDSSKMEQSYYKNIYKLEHSHWLRITAEGDKKKQRYYDINWKKQDFKGTIDDAIIEFERLFLISLKRRCRADVPVGTSLSGGLDSSSIVCNMAKWQGQGSISAHTFSARFEGFKKDEGNYIEKVIEKTGVIPHATWPTGDEMYRDFEKLCWYQEEPFGSASIYAQYRVQQMAKEHGITVLIDGQGADEILAGYNIFYHEYMDYMHYKWPFWSFDRIKEQHKYIDYFYFSSSFKKSLSKLFFKLEIKGKLKKILRKTSLFSLNQSLYHQTMNGGLQELLRFADRNSMAHGREIRLPFLNHELVEFCFSLPDTYKLHLGWTKYIMRKAFDPILPPEIAWRREKVAFETPQSEWLSFFEEQDWTKLMNKYY